MDILAFALGTTVGSLLARIAQARRERKKWEYEDHLIEVLSDNANGNGNGFYPTRTYYHQN